MQQGLIKGALRSLAYIKFRFLRCPQVQAQKSQPSLIVDKASPSQGNPAEELARRLEQFRAAGRQGRVQRDLKIEAAKPEPVIEPQQELQRERSLKKEKEQEPEIRGYGHGFSR